VVPDEVSRHDTLANRMRSPFDEQVQRPVRPVALLLFSSGLCAQVYQIAWLRELRLVFGVTRTMRAP